MRLERDGKLHDWILTQTQKGQMNSNAPDMPSCQRNRAKLMVCWSNFLSSALLLLAAVLIHRPIVATADTLTISGSGQAGDYTPVSFIFTLNTPPGQAPIVNMLGWGWDSSSMAGVTGSLQVTAGGSTQSFGTQAAHVIVYYGDHLYFGLASEDFVFDFPSSLQNSPSLATVTNGVIQEQPYYPADGTAMYYGSVPWGYAYINYATASLTASAMPVTITVNASSGGTASASLPSGLPGSTTVLTAVPANGSAYSSWTLNNAGGGSISSTTTNPATFTFGSSNAIVTANFTQLVSVVVTNTPGGVALATPVAGAPGTTTTLTAFPSNGYAFSFWGLTNTGGGILSFPTANPATFTFGNSNANITAHFAFTDGSFLVTNVFALQRSTNKLVDITYDLSASSTGAVNMTIEVSTNNGVTFDLPAVSFTPLSGSWQDPGTGCSFVWNAGADWNHHVSSQVAFRVTAGGSISAVSPPTTVDTRDGVPPEPEEILRTDQPHFDDKPPQPAPANAVIIVHGANDTSAGWAQQMAVLMRQRSLPDNFITTLNWSEWSHHTLPIVGLPMWWTMEHADEAGRILAKLIQENGFQRVHLIGHSLGGRVIQTATEELWRTSNPSIHLTFLDTYTRLDSKWVNVFGDKANYAEHYFHKGDWAGTESQLPLALNVDITNLRGGVEYPDPVPPGWPWDNSTFLHGWPYRWYTYTVMEYPIVNPWNRGHLGYGFALSKEAGNSTWPMRYDSDSLGTPHPPPTLPPSRAHGLVVSHINIGSDHLDSDGNATVTSSELALQGTNSSWASFQIQPTMEIDTIKLAANFTSSPSADGLFSVYVDGERVAFYLEQNLLSRAGELTINLPTPLAASNHIVSCRLDPAGNTASSIVITNMALLQTIQVPALGIAPQSNGVVSLAWMATPDSQYQVQYATGLGTSNWMALGRPLWTTNASLSVSDNSNLSTQRYYRLSVWPAETALPSNALRAGLNP